MINCLPYAPYERAWALLTQHVSDAEAAALRSRVTADLAAIEVD